MNIIFEQSPDSGYKERTFKNASADATIAIAIKFDSAGEILTKNYVKNQGKKLISIDANNLEVTQERVDKIVKMLNSIEAKTLNIAGNGMYTITKSGSKLTQKQLDDFTYELLKNVLNHPGLLNKIELIRSGGQTGADESGAKAGVKLGVKTLIYAPKGWKFVGSDGITVCDEERFKSRFK